ncbi:hypothetical protein Tco_0968431 [Tanacetum coccineum]
MWMKTSSIGSDNPHNNVFNDSMEFDHDVSNRAALIHNITDMELEFERHITTIEQYLKIPTSCYVEKCMDIDHVTKQQDATGKNFFDEEEQHVASNNLINDEVTSKNLEVPLEGEELVEVHSLIQMIDFDIHKESPPEHPKDKTGLDASAKLTRDKLNKRSGDADLSKDNSGPESPLEFRRSWYVEGHIRSGVISSVLMQQYQRTIRQRYSPCEGPLSLKGHVADKLYQERAPRLCLVANPNWYKGRAHFLETEDTTPFRTILYILRIYLTIILADKELCSKGTKPNSIFTTAEHDQQSKMKAIPRKLAYADSNKEAPVGSLAKGFSDRFSLESSGTSDTHRKTRSTIKSQKTPSKNKEPTYLRRSRRLENQNTTKEKEIRERSKFRRKRSGHQETSSDFEYEEGSDDAFEDLNSPYKWPKPTPFTQRITHFKYHKRVRNSKVSFAVQHHNRKDQNEKPRSNGFYHLLHD